MPDEGENQVPPAAEAPEAPQQPAQAPETGAQNGQTGELKARVAELEAREKELVDRLARLQADFENFRRRSREDVAAASGRGKESFLKALLPVLDNLDRALAFSEDEGLRLLSRQLRQTLDSQGIVVLDPQGEAFDAKLHEAIAQQSAEGVKSGQILAVAEKGYSLEGRVLRPARVIVAA